MYVTKELQKKTKEIADNEFEHLLKLLHLHLTDEYIRALFLRWAFCMGSKRAIAVVSSFYSSNVFRAASSIVHLNAMLLDKKMTNGKYVYERKRIW